MSPGHTAASQSWCNAGMLILEDGLMYARAIDGRSAISDSGASLSSFECVVLCSLAGVAVSAALLLALPAEMLAAVTAGLAL